MGSKNLKNETKMSALLRGGEGGGGGGGGRGGSLSYLFIKQGASLQCRSTRRLAFQRG